MKKVNLDISIPASLSEITLGEYQRYMKIVDANKSDENAGDFLNLKALEIFCGLDTTKLHNLPVKHFYFALEQLEKCFREDTPKVNEFVFKDVNGVEQPMGFIPNLDKMSYGEYVDLDKYIADWQTMHRAMAVLYRPIRIKQRHQYHIDEYSGTETYAEAMKEMPVSIAMGALVFFYRLGMKLCEYTIPCLASRVELSEPQRNALLRIGDGIQQSLRSAEETLLKSMKQQKFLYTKQ